MTPNLEEGLQAVAARLQTIIDKVRGADDVVFVKPSCRSAHDTAVYNTRYIHMVSLPKLEEVPIFLSPVSPFPVAILSFVMDINFFFFFHSMLFVRFRELYRTVLSRNKKLDENSAIAALLEVAIEMLKVSSAHDVIHNFIHSERVYNDFSIALQHPDRFQNHFVVRKWVSIDPDMEFRGFYANGKLNALCQYNHLAFYPRLVLLKDTLATLIQSFFALEVEPKLRSTFKEYVVDFAVVGPNLDKVYVIELNPFLYTTDGALFSWSNERAILEHGPFEFRILSAPIPGGKAMLAQDWRTLLEQETKSLMTH